MSDHRARYKNTGLDARELRRRREQDSVQLRRQRRDDVLTKRRTITRDYVDDMHDNENESQFNNDNDDDSNESLSNNHDQDPDQEEFQITKDTIDGLTQSSDVQLLIDNARKIRKILSKEPQPPFDGVIHSGLVPRFVQLLDHPNTTLQFETAWILTNICSGPSHYTMAVVETGAVPKLVGLLSSPDLRVSEQAVWALGNIIGDSAELRDFVISHGFVPALIDLIRPTSDIGFLRNDTWVLVNICRNKQPPPNIEVIKQLIPAIVFLITCQTDLAILMDITWAVSYITELGPDYAQLIIDNGLVHHVVPFLAYKDVKIQTAAIRALGSIVTGNENQTQAVIDAQALPKMAKLLTEGSDRIVKEALWFISNITAGSTSQVQAVIDNGLIPLIVHHLSTGDFTRQKEAAWALYNLALSGVPKQVQKLADDGAVEPLCNLLSVQDTNVVRNVLEALSCILSVVSQNDDGKTCELIEECGGLDLIEQLQTSPNNDIYSFASSIVEQYFDGQ